MKSAILESSPDTRFLRQKLRELKKGELISYAKLSEILGKKVHGRTWSLYSAKKFLLKEDMVLVCVPGEGVMRLDDAQIVSAADVDLTFIRHKSRRASKKLIVADYTRLSNPQKLSHTAKLSIMAAVGSMTTNGAIKAIEKVASGRSGELPIIETIKALGYVSPK